MCIPASFQMLTLRFINPRLRACAARVIIVGLYVCVRVRPSVHRFSW